MIVRTAPGRRLPAAAKCALAAFLLSVHGCSVKREVVVAVPAGIREPKTASFEELTTLLGETSGKIGALSSTSMQVTFTSGRIESGRLQEYRSAPGYILLRRPDSIRVNIQNPVTKTTILDLLSVGDDFSIWYPRENKFFTGKNSAREFDLEGGPNFTVRPIHMFQAIMPAGFERGSPDTRLSMEEDQDATTRYYIVGFYREPDGAPLTPVRRLWIDRSNLTVVRQQTYAGLGFLESVSRYSDFVPSNGVDLPLSIRMERPADGYSLDMRFKSWRLNPDLPDSAFKMNPPGGAQIVVLKEKG